MTTTGASSSAPQRPVVKRDDGNLCRGRCSQRRSTLDQRQDLQDRDDELAAARATNRDLMTRLNSRAPNNEQVCTTRVVHTT